VTWPRICAPGPRRGASNPGARRSRNTTSTPTTPLRRGFFIAATPAARDRVYHLPAHRNVLARAPTPGKLNRVFQCVPVYASGTLARWLMCCVFSGLHVFGVVARTGARGTRAHWVEAPAFQLKHPDPKLFASRGPNVIKQNWVRLPPQPSLVS